MILFIRPSYHLHAPLHTIFITSSRSSSYNLHTIFIPSSCSYSYHLHGPLHTIFILSSRSCSYNLHTIFIPSSCSSSYHHNAPLHAILIPSSCSSSLKSTWWRCYTCICIYTLKSNNELCCYSNPLSVHLASYRQLCRCFSPITVVPTLALRFVRI
jgi:hypothetical protein